MRDRRWIVPGSLLLVMLLPLLSSNHAHAGDFMDTRITFAISDNNLLAGPGETNPNSPSTSFIGGRRSTLFFDNYNTRFSGFESLSHAVLYKKLPSFFKNLTTATALVVRMNYQLERRIFELSDSGSYIVLEYNFSNSKSLRRNIKLTAFPLSSDRFRLGYSFRISWGGDLTFPRRTLRSPVPGMRLQYNYDFSTTSGMFLFLGGKTAFLQKRLQDTTTQDGQTNNTEQIEEETAYGLLGGAGFYAGGFRLEVGGAIFDKGTFSNPAVKGETVLFYGFSGQISYSVGMPIGVSIDFQLYRNDPQAPMRFFRPEKYEPGKFSFQVAAESSFLVNLLENPDDFGGITPTPGVAADLNFRMKYGYFRLHADFVFRDLGFIVANVPGFVPFQGFSEKQKISPEFFIAVGADYHIPAAYLTIGLKGGVQFPASFQGDLPAQITGNNASETLQGEQLVLVRDEGDLVLLPLVDKNGNAVAILPIFSAKINFKWQISSFLAAIGEVLFTLDNNETRLTKDQATGVVFREFVDPVRVGFNVMLQARF